MWQNRILAFVLTSVIAGPASAQEIVAVSESPREAMRKEVFKGALDKRGCKVIKTDPRGGLVGFDAELDSFVKLTVSSIQSQNVKKILPLFHKGMKIEYAAVDQTFKRLNSTYKAPFDVSVYRMWALNTVDGSPKGIDCADDRLKVYPLYGHKLQFGLWLQIMGQQELGRIYLSLVPSKDRWNIGSFHSQQWTHDGKDFATWAEEANKSARMGYPMAAWAKYDVAYKLLDGGGFLDIAMQQEIAKARDGLMTREQWDKAIVKVLKEWDVGYTASMLVAGGVGVLARIKIEKELSLDDMNEQCGKIGKAFLAHDWHTQLVGVRCSYIMPREDPRKEGGLGGMLVRFADLKPKSMD